MNTATAAAAADAAASTATAVNMERFKNWSAADFDKFETFLFDCDGMYLSCIGEHMTS
jgi:hypothetical protein